jgi:hypothetical protein
MFPVNNRVASVISRSLTLRRLNRKTSREVLILQNLTTENLVRDVSIGEVGRGESSYAFYFSLPPTRQQHRHLKFRSVTMIYDTISFYGTEVFSARHVACEAHLKSVLFIAYFLRYEAFYFPLAAFSIWNYR